MLLIAIISLATYSIKTSSPVIINFSVFWGSFSDTTEGFVLYEVVFLVTGTDFCFLLTSGNLGVIVVLVDAWWVVSVVLIAELV